jgi:YebC/PmpR family DNA-binding regulatory protein
MVEVTTDNRKRTVAELRHLITKHGGKLGESGCVAWMFERKGVITLDKNGTDEEALLDVIVNGGGDDFSDEGDVYIVHSAPEDLPSVTESVEDGGFNVRSSEVLQMPTNSVAVEGETARKTLQLMEALDDHDDVQRVSANFDIDDEKLESVG